MGGEVGDRAREAVGEAGREVLSGDEPPTRPPPEDVMPWGEIHPAALARYEAKYGRVKRVRVAG